MRHPTWLLLALVIGCGEVVTDPGPVDPCPGAVCECTTATEADDCGAHQFCEETGDNRECKCVALYEDAAGECQFVGGPADPGFQDPAAWTVTGTGMTVDGGASGIEQPGELTIDKNGACAYAVASQTITMPPYNRADSLKVSLTYHVADQGGGAPDFAFESFLQFSVGGQFHEFKMVKNVVQTKSFCLGEAAFGGPVEIKIGSVTKAPNCMTPPTAGKLIRIDEFKYEIAEPGECPTQPGILNGSFQLATGGVFPGVQAGVGQIVADIGENGSFGGRLTQANRCSEVTARGTIAIPSDLQHPALDIYWNGTSSARLAVKLGGKGIGTLNANGTIKHSQLCLPKWSLGNTTTLDLLAQRTADNDCSTALNRTFILDNMTIVDEPACGTLADVADPGFEFITDNEGPMPAWSLTNGMVNDVEGGHTVVLNQQSQAATGLGVLRTSNLNLCVGTTQQGPGAEIAFIVPPAQAGAGPAVKFVAKAATANTNTETRAHLVPDTGVTINVPETGAYVANTLCIPPNMSGRLTSVRLMTAGIGGGCIGNFPEEFAFFDDIQITTDAACPVP